MEKGILGLTSGIENICFAFGTKNETVGTNNQFMEIY